MTEWEIALEALREGYGLTEDQLESLNAVWNLIRVKSQDLAQPPDCDIGDDVVTLTWSFKGTLAYISIQEDGRMNWFFDSPLTGKSRSRLDRTVTHSEAVVFVDLLDEFFRS